MFVHLFASRFIISLHKKKTPQHTPPPQPTIHTQPPKNHKTTVPINIFKKQQTKKTTPTTPPGTHLPQNPNHHPPPHPPSHHTPNQKSFTLKKKIPNSHSTYPSPAALSDPRVPHLHNLDDLTMCNNIFKSKTLNPSTRQLSSINPPTHLNQSNKAIPPQKITQYIPYKNKKKKKKYSDIINVTSILPYNIYRGPFNIKITSTGTVLKTGNTLLLPSIKKNQKPQRPRPEEHVTKVTQPQPTSSTCCVAIEQLSSSM